MTLSSESRKSQLFTGSGSTGPFPFTFKVFAKEDLVVTTSVIATGVETTLALDTDYTVLLNKDQDGNPGGSVTLKNGVGEHGPLPTTKRLLISGGMSLTQPQEIGNQDGFFAEDIENALDRAMIAAQQLKVDVDRAFKLPLTGTYQNPDALVNGVLESAADAEAAQVAAEAAQAAAELAQTGAETAQAGAETAETNAQGYVLTAQGVATTVFADYTTAIGAGLSTGDKFRLDIGENIYVYQFTSGSPNYGTLLYTLPVNYAEATNALALSSGIAPNGSSLPGTPVIDILGADALYHPNQIRNRAEDKRPNVNLLGITDPAQQPLYGYINDNDPSGIGVYSKNVSDELVVSFTPSGAGQTYSVGFDNVFVPPGKWTFAFDAKGIGTSYNFRYSADGGSSYSTGTATTSFSTFSISFDNSTAGVRSFQFFREESGSSSPAAIIFDNVRVIPGASATYAEPAERHGWHKRGWSFGEGKLVPANDDLLVDNLHFQVPFQELKSFEEATFSLAVKPTSNDAAQALSVTSPSGQPFTILLTPSTVFGSSPPTAGGYIGFNSVGSTDIAVQVREAALPVNKFSVLTVVFPKEQGLASSPVRIYMNGILLQNVEEAIPVKATSRTNDSTNLRFNFGKAHNFVEDQPVTVTKSGVGSAFPTGIDDVTTYYVRLPATNPQEGIYLSLTEGGDPIEYGASPGVDNIFVRSQRRPVGTVPFTADTVSMLGNGTIENIAGVLGLNFEGELANVVLYDKALTDAEVQRLVSVQKQRIAAHQEQASSLGSVLLTEGDSITFGIGTDANQTFRFRLFYGMDFNEHTASSITAEDAEQPFTATDGTPELVINASGHQFQNGNAVQFTTDNTLPGGLTAGVTHYVINRTDNTFEVSLTSGGPAISYVNAGTGTHQVKFVTDKLLLTFPSAHGYDTGDAVYISSTNTLPTGFTGGDIYYVQKRSNTTMFLSTLSLVTSPAVEFVDDGIGDATIKSFVPDLDDAAEKLNVINFATSGSLISDTLARRDSVVDAIEKVVAEGSRPIVVYMAGMNDLILGLGGAPLDATKINLLGAVLQDVWTSYRNAGAKLIVCTVTAANENDLPNDPLLSTGFYTEALRSQLNDKIRSLSAYYDALADLGATAQVGTWQPPFIGTPPVVNPASYFFDNIHPDFQGHVVMSNILSPLVDNFRL